MVFDVTLVVAIAFVLIGICLILKRGWAYKVASVLSSVLLLGSWVLGIKMVIYGISDVNTFQTPGSCVRLIFGLTALFASLPFFVVNKNIKKLMHNKSKT